MKKKPARKRPKTSSYVKSESAAPVEVSRINLADVADVSKRLGVSEYALLEAARRWAAPIDERASRLAEARRRAQLRAMPADFR